MINRKDICQMGIVVVIVTAFSFVMLLNDYNNMINDYVIGDYETYEGKYNDFKSFNSGMTIADNGVVNRNVYMGYVNNIIVDNDFMELNKGEITVESLEGAKYETVFKMLLTHFHYIMAVFMFLLYKLMDYLMVILIGLNGVFVKHKGDISDSNFQNIITDLKDIYSTYNNNFQMVLAITYAIMTSFLIRMSLNLDDFSILYITLISYALISVLNYILKMNIDKGSDSKNKDSIKDENKG